MALPPTKAERAQRRASAVEMLRGGASIESIAIRLRYPSTTACVVDLQRALAEIVRMPNEEARAVELSRLDGLLLAHWPAARAGNMAATDRILKIIQTRAQLLGLNAPTRSELVTMDMIEAEVQRLERELGPAKPRREQPVPLDDA